jgi:hypothetical protein
MDGSESKVSYTQVHSIMAALRAYILQTILDMLQR